MIPLLLFSLVRRAAAGGHPAAVVPADCGRSRAPGSRPRSILSRPHGDYQRVCTTATHGKRHHRCFARYGSRGPKSPRKALKGDLVQSFELKDLFSAAEIEKFDHTVSSIWWRKMQIANVRQGQQALYVALNDKRTELIFETEGRLAVL